MIQVLEPINGSENGSERARATEDVESVLSKRNVKGGDQSLIRCESAKLFNELRVMLMGSNRVPHALNAKEGRE